MQGVRRTRGVGTEELGVSMTKEQREELAHLKREINSPKRDLIDILRRVERLSPREAAKLETIIGKLESWQSKP